MIKRIKDYVLTGDSSEMDDDELSEQIVVRNDINRNLDIKEKKLNIINDQNDIQQPSKE
jgi:hypothetical protein